MADTVGFIGLGIMGKPMAENLIEAGYGLVAYNRTREKAEELDGATVAETPKAVAEQSDIIITMLPDSPQVEEVLAGEDGVLEGVKDGALIVDMSTISPVVTEELSEKGKEEDFERALPLFEVMGGAVTHVGPSGAGQVVKAANQIVVALPIEAVSEALVLGSKGGVAPEKILDVLSGGLAGNKVMEAKREKLLEHSFDPGFRIELHHKDLGIALAAGREYGVTLPVTAIVEQMLLAMINKGWG